jgi:hypothetical protein
MADVTTIQQLQKFKQQHCQQQQQHRSRGRSASKHCSSAHHERVHPTLCFIATRVHASLLPRLAKSMLCAQITSPLLMHAYRWGMLHCSCRQAEVQGGGSAPYACVHITSHLLITPADQPYHWSILCAAVAGKQKCRVEALPLTPDTVQLTSGSSATFDGPAQTMTLGLQGSSSSHAAVTGSSMLYGQVEVTAMVNAASDGFSTAFYLQSSSSSSTSSTSSKNSTDRISYQFATGGSPPVPNAVLMSSTTR